MWGSKSEKAVKKCAISAVFQVALILIVFPLMLPFAALSAGPMLDQSITNLWRGDVPFILQADFGGSAPGVKARLFGTSDDGKKFNITFSNLLSGPSSLTLDGRPLKNGAAAVPAKVTCLPQGDHYCWQWEGVFKVAGTEEKSAIQISLSGQSHNQPNQVFTAQLGDVWVVAGGENVRTTATVEPPPEMEVELVAGLADPNSTPVIVEVPATPPRTTNAPITVPFLSWKFGSDLERSNRHPVAVYTIPQAHASFATWTNPESWSPLPVQTNDNGRAITIGTRGIIWWWGEWQAEYGDFPNPLPAELDTASANWPQIVGDWQQLQAEQFNQCLTNYIGMTARDDYRSNLLSLVVQLQGVDRQPPTVNLFSYPTNDASAWEHFRDAESDVLSDLESKVTQGRFALIPASASSADRFPVAWFWDTNGLSFMADKLAGVAQNYTPPRVNFGELPQVSWQDPAAVVLTFGGAFNDSPASNRPPNSASLQYLTASKPGLWNVYTNDWTPVIRLVEANTAISAVRYGAGNSPFLGHSMTIDSNSLSATIPTFEFFRPPP